MWLIKKDKNIRCEVCGETPPASKIRMFMGRGCDLVEWQCKGCGHVNFIKGDDETK